MDSFSQLVPELTIESLAPLLPLALFLVSALVMSIVVRSRTKKANTGFVKSYFIGNRAMGGFVLAMTTIATYGSVSSFVGGPGQAWQTGFGWVYMSVVQVTALVLLYGILGKKMALIARKIDAVTVVDVIRARYGSNALANAAAVIVVVFFMAIMVAQFVGGAKLFEAVTGYSYVIGLVLFGVAVVLFTTIGGFRGVAVTDTLCGIAMLVGIGVLAYGILHAGGGYEAIMNYITLHSPAMLEPFADGSMPPSLYFTQWLLVGMLTFVLPQSVVRTLGYKDVKSLHTAMIWGTVIIGAMMIGVTTLGVLSAGVLTKDLASYGGSVDNIIPAVIVQSLPPVVAGIAIIGPVAASISTVSSLLISSSSAIVKDIFLAACERRGVMPRDKKVAVWSQFFTLGIGVLVFVLSVVPPEIIWKINMFAFGGLETAFFFVLVCGLFWKKANATGACWSMIAGTVAYCVSMAIGFRIAELHQIVIGLVIAGYFMVLGSLVGRQKKTAQLDVFFPSATASAPAGLGAPAPAPRGLGTSTPAPTPAGMGAPAPAAMGAPAAAALGASSPAPAGMGAPAAAGAMAAAGRPAPVPGRGMGAPAPVPTPTRGMGTPAPATLGAAGSPAPVPASAPLPGNARAPLGAPLPAAAAAAPLTAAPGAMATGAAGAGASFGAPASAVGSFGAPLAPSMNGAAPMAAGVSYPAAGASTGAAGGMGAAFGQAAPTNPYAAASSALRSAANPYAGASTPSPAAVPSPLSPPAAAPLPTSPSANPWGMANSYAAPATSAYGAPNPYGASLPYGSQAAAHTPHSMGGSMGNAMGASMPGTAGMYGSSVASASSYGRPAPSAYPGASGMGYSAGYPSAATHGAPLSSAAPMGGYGAGQPYGAPQAYGGAPSYGAASSYGAAHSYGTPTSYGAASPYGAPGAYGMPQTTPMSAATGSYAAPPRPAAPSTPYVPGGPQYGYGSALPGTSPLANSPMLSGPPSQFQMPPDGYGLSRSQQRAMRQEAKAARRARGQY